MGLEIFLHLWPGFSPAHLGHGASSQVGGFTYLSLWFPSALVSSLTLFVFYAATRQFFSKSLAIVCAGMWAFGYWPFLLGRYCHEGIWLPLWACLCGYFLGRFLKSSTPQSRKWNSLILGFAAGLGSWTFTPWPFLGLALFWALFCPTFSKPFRNLGLFPYFVLGALPALGPFLWAVWNEGYGQHISSTSALSGWFSMEHQVRTILSYFTELFWGTLENDSGYIAAFGGMLNPIAASFFFMGLLRLIRSRSLPLVQWIFFAFFLVLLPGLLSMNVETFRVALALPFIYLIAALGMAHLLTACSPVLRLRILLVFLMAGAFIDGARMLQSQRNPLDYPVVSADGAFPMANLRAFKVLKGLNDRYGPGLILTEFFETPYDQSLFDLTYSYNEAENRKLKGSARWAALLTDTGFYPLLHQRFPESVWYDLGKNNPEDPEMLLGTFPVNTRNEKTLALWVDAHHYFRDLSWKINSINEDKTYRAADLLFSQKPEEIAEDPFLEASYWDRRAEFFYYYNFKSHYTDQVEALEMALRGYPSAYLSYKLGSLFARKGQYQKAREAYEKSLRASPGDPKVLAALTLLQGLEAKTIPWK